MNATKPNTKTRKPTPKNVWPEWLAKMRKNWQGPVRPTPRLHLGVFTGKL